MLAESSPRSPQAPSVSYESDTGSRKYSEFLYFLSNLVDTYAHQVLIYLKILSISHFNIVIKKVFHI